MAGGYTIVLFTCFLVDHILDGRGVISVADPGADQRADGQHAQRHDQVVGEVLGIVEDADLMVALSLQNLQ